MLAKYLLAILSRYNLAGVKLIPKNTAQRLGANQEFTSSPSALAHALYIQNLAIDSSEVEPVAISFQAVWSLSNVCGSLLA